MKCSRSSRNLQGEPEVHAVDKKKDAIGLGLGAVGSAKDDGDWHVGKLRGAHEAKLGQRGAARFGGQDKEPTRRAAVDWQALGANATK